MTIKKIKYHRVYEDVIEQIKNLILEGNLTPGDVLPTERSWPNRLALVAGHCGSFPHSGARRIDRSQTGGGRFLSKALDVAEDRSRILDNIERATIIELLEARELFETGIVELAAKRATDEDIAEIEAAFATWGDRSECGRSIEAGSSIPLVDCESHA